MVNVLSINGKLQKLSSEVSENKDRSTKYNPIKIGKPLVIEYIRFFVKNDSKTKEKLMISSHLKTEEQKKVSAEAINYFNEEASFEKGIFELTNYGGKNYGHPLIYYTKSYLGESIRLTTKIHDLNKITKEESESIRNLIQTVAMPVISGLLPGAGIAGAISNPLLEVGEKIVRTIINGYRRDDKLIEEDMDLYFDRVDVNNLQSGRIVCIPGINDSDKLIGKYKLTSGDNKLKKIDGDIEYQDGSYFVIKVQNKKIDTYNQFEYYQNAADMLAKTNRGSYLEVLNEVTNILEPYKDVEILKKINSLQFKSGKDTKTMTDALINSMSDSGIAIFTPLLEKIKEKNDLIE